MKYILITLVAVSITTFLVYKFANGVFKLQLRLRPIILCGVCAILISLVLPRIVVGFTGIAGTLVFLALFAIIFAYFVARYDIPKEIQPKIEKDAIITDDFIIEQDSSTPSSATGKHVFDNIKEFFTEEFEEEIEKQVHSGLDEKTELFDRKPIMKDFTRELEVVIDMDNKYQKNENVQENLNKNVKNNYDIVILPQNPEMQGIVKPQTTITEPRVSTITKEASITDKIPVKKEIDSISTQIKKIEYPKPTRSTVVPMQAKNSVKEEVVNSDDLLKSLENTKSVKSQVDSLMPELKVDLPIQPIQTEKITTEEVKDIGNLSKTLEISEQIEKLPVISMEPENTVELPKQPIQAEKSTAEKIIEEHIDSGNLLNTLEISKQVEESLASFSEPEITIELPEQLVQEEQSSKEEFAGQNNPSLEHPNAVDTPEVSTELPLSVELSKEPMDDYYNISHPKSFEKQEPLELSVASSEQLLSAGFNEVPLMDEFMKAEDPLDSVALVENVEPQEFAEPVVVPPDKLHNNTLDEVEIVAETASLGSAPKSDSLEDLMDFAFKQKERKNYEQALSSFFKALRLYYNTESAPFLIIEIGNIFKNIGAYDEAIQIFSEGRQLPVLKGDEMLEQEFINTVAYLRIVKDTLLQHQLNLLPYGSINATVFKEIDAEFRRWCESA